MDGVELDFEQEAVDLIAQKAIKRKTGARALKSIVEGLMLDIMYDIPSDDSIKKFTITKAMVEEANEGDDKEKTPKNLIEMPQKNQAESA